MESNRKRRGGFMKGKLMPFYRSPKPTSNVQYSSKVKPIQSSPTTASVGFVVHPDYIISPPKQKVSFILPTADSNRQKLVKQFDKLYGVAGDESVDIKAASYISSVQERFKLERSNLERFKHEDMKQIIYNEDC